MEVGCQEVLSPGAPRHSGHPEGGGRGPVQREDLQKASLGYDCIISSHWQKSQVRPNFACCTADSQADKDRNQLNNNLENDELETFASD